MYDYEPVMTPASKPLTLESYTTYVLVPYIAAWLIGEDIGTDVDGGWEEMQRGNTRETIDASNDSESDAVNEEDHKAIVITQKGKKGKENQKPNVYVIPSALSQTVCVQLYWSRSHPQSRKEMLTPSRRNLRLHQAQATSSVCKTSLQ